MTTEDEFHSETPPPEHPTWVPAGRPGHFCVAERHCGCGHWSGVRYATLRADGRRGRVDLDSQEGNAGNR